MFVRQMAVSDIDRAYEIACVSLEERYVKEVFLLFIGKWPSGQLIASDEVGNIMGFISGNRMTYDKVSIQLFAVDPRYRSKGVGSRLISEFKARTIMDGRQYIQLEMDAGNQSAAMFYGKRGFSPVTYLEGFYNNGGDAVRMVCDVRRYA